MEAEIELREVPRPDPAPHEVRVRVRAVGLCGTDLHIYAGHANYHRDELGRLVSLRESPQILGHEIAEKLFDLPASAVGHRIRLDGHELTVRGVIAPKGRLLGQSFDAFVLLPFSTFEALYGRRKTTVVSVKMHTADEIDGAMARAEEAMRVAHRLRPGEDNDFTVDKADAFVAFWKKLTAVLFTAIPAVVAIGIVVGGIVIMNIMLMVVSERYPQLQANQGFRDLRVQLEGTENRITDARNRYIKSVQEYNVLTRRFPTNLTAKVFGYEVKPNFTVQNEAAISAPPSVSFDKSAPATAPATPAPAASPASN